MYVWKQHYVWELYGDDDYDDDDHYNHMYPYVA